MGLSAENESRGGPSCHTAHLSPDMLATIARNKEAAKARKAKRLAEAKAKLQAAVGIDDAATPNGAPDTAPRGGGKINRKANEQGNTSFANSNCWYWPDDASLPLADTSHREAGLWAFDTVNPNAWPAGSEYMAKSGADVILTQEVKVPADCPKLAAEQAARSLKWKVAIEPCQITPAGGRSAGTAVAARAYIGMSTPKAAEANKHLHPRGHFSIKRIAAAGKRRDPLRQHLLLQHARPGRHSGQMQPGPAGSQRLHPQVAGRPVLPGGDWNGSPEDLRATGWLKKIGATICAPAAPTCNGSTYDYFVVSTNIAHKVVATHVIGDAGFMPHSPARLIFQGLPRKVMVRHLEAPANIPAILPHGPLNKTSPCLGDLERYFKPAETLFKELSDITSAILYGLMGIDTASGTDAKPPSTWSNGPRFACGNVASPAATDETRTTPVSRAWRRTVAWLRVVRANKNPSLAKSAKWKLLSYNHPIKADDEAMKDEKCGLQCLASHAH